MTSIKELSQQEQCHTSALTSFAAQSSSPLLSLPGELRNQIYKHAFDSSTYNVVYRDRQGTVVIDAKRESDQESPRTSLLLTCRRIHYETVEMSLELTTFVFDSLSTFYFVERLSAGAQAAVRHAQVTISLEVERNLGWLLDDMYLSESRADESLPNLKSIQYDLSGYKSSFETPLKSVGNKMFMELLEEWFVESDKVEVRIHIVER